MKFCLKYLVLLFCISCIDATTPGYVYSKGLKLWYKFHTMPVTWFNARRTCAIEGGILASPTTKLITKGMRLMTEKREFIFTGLHATYAEGFYFTVDGQPLEAFPHEWAENEPDNKQNSERCLAINSAGKLLDVRCEQPLAFLCLKKDMKPETICGTSDPEYIHYTETNKCYKFHTKPENFTEANFVCSAEGGHLAIINSEAEAGVIRNLINKHPENSMVGEFWKEIIFVGFHNWGIGGDWRTIHGETLRDAGYEKFRAGEPKFPNGIDQYCGAVFRDATLDDTYCSRLISFICEKGIRNHVKVHPVEQLTPGSYQQF